MPLQEDGNYQAPKWINDSTPAIDADELQAMCDTIAKLKFGKGTVLSVEAGGTGASNAKDARKNLGFGTDGSLPLSLGGTGATNAKDARKNLFGNNGVLGLADGGTGHASSSLDDLKKYLGITGDENNKAIIIAKPQQVLYDTYTKNAFVGLENVSGYIPVNAYVSSPKNNGDIHVKSIFKYYHENHWVALFNRGLTSSEWIYLQVVYVLATTTL